MLGWSRQATGPALYPAQLRAGRSARIGAAWMRPNPRIQANPNPWVQPGPPVPCPESTLSQPSVAGARAALSTCSQAGTTAGVSPGAKVLMWGGGGWRPRISAKDTAPTQQRCISTTSYVRWCPKSHSCVRLIFLCQHSSWALRTLRD